MVNRTNFGGKSDEASTDNPSQLEIQKRVAADDEVEEEDDEGV